MAKYTLHNDIDLYQFVLLGISSPENQYLLVNALNEGLNLKLELQNYLNLSMKQGRLFDFSVYGFLDEELGLDYFFLPNKSNFKPLEKNNSVNDLFTNSELQVEEAALLVPELPHTNYFLILKGDSALHEQYQVFQSLKNIELIHQVHEIIPERLASRQNLVF
jgi:hypothetical protein